MKKLFYPLALGALLVLTGCAAPTKVTTTTSIDPNTKEEFITIVEEPADNTSFWESGNLKNYYEFETKRLESFNENVDKKINAIKENSIARASIEMTNTERLLTNIIDGMLIAQIPVVPSPSGQTAPITMTDFFNKNLVGLTSVALQAYGIFLHSGNSGDDASVKITNTGAGDVFYQSYDNKNPKYKLAEGAVGTFDLSLDNAPTYDYSSSVTTTNDSSSHSSTLW